MEDRVITTCPSCGTRNRRALGGRASRGIWKCGRCGHTLEEKAAGEMFARVFASDTGAWDIVNLGGASILTAVLAAIITVVLDAGLRWVLGGMRIVFFPCLLGGMLVGLAVRLFSTGNRNESAFIVLGGITLYMVRWWIILDCPPTFQQMGASLYEYSHRPFSLSMGGKIGGEHAHIETAGGVIWFWLLFLLDVAGVFQGALFGARGERV